jgi:hypothetical protein
MYTGSRESILAKYRELGIPPVSGGSGEPPPAGDPAPADPAKGKADPDPAKGPEFQPVTSQEDLDLIVAKRLKRQEATLRKETEEEIRKSIQAEAEAERRKAAGEFEDLYKAEQTKVGTLESEIERLKVEIEERDRRGLREKIAKKHNLPDDLANRLVGDDEKALEEDAKRLAGVVQLKAPNTEGGAGSGPGKKAGGNRDPGPYSFRKSAVVPFPDRRVATKD